MLNNPSGNKRYHSTRSFRPGLILVFLACSFTFNSLATGKEVYKWVAEDGTVFFSDQPHDGAQKLKIKPLPTVPALKKPTRAPSKNKIDDEQTVAYKSISITSPADQSAFYSGNGNISVAIAVDPALRSGDTIQLSVDGQVNDNGSGNSLILNNISRGTHTLKADIIRHNKILLSSKPVSFTVHRPSVINKRSN